jgi:hypothetical protein
VVVPASKRTAASVEDACGGGGAGLMSLYGWRPETATGPGDPTKWSDSPAAGRGNSVGRRLSLAILAAAASGEDRPGVQALRH